MPPIAIVLRGSRAVVSCAIQTPRGPGWHCASNWRSLESAAFDVISHTMIEGPFVYRCPPTLAAAAEWGDLPGSSIQAPLFESEVRA